MPVFLFNGRWEEGVCGSAEIMFGDYLPHKSNVETPTLIDIGVEPGDMSDVYRAAPPRMRQMELYFGAGWDDLDIVGLSEGKRFFVSKRLINIGASSVNDNTDPRYHLFVQPTVDEFRQFLPEYLARLGVPLADLPAVIEVITERLRPLL